jgi:hypothetical protein
MKRTSAVPLILLLSAASACRSEPFVPEDGSTAGPATQAEMGRGVSSFTGRLDGLDGHSATGRVEVTVDSAGVATVRLFPDFASHEVPDPHLYLNTAPTVHRGRPLRIGVLRASRGEQRYTFRTENAPFSHLVIWCNRYDVGVASAALVPTR